MNRIGITGHRDLDEPTRGMVRSVLRSIVRAYSPAELVGVTCLADGADTLFAQAVTAHGGRLEVVVPSARYRECLPAPHRRVYDDLLSEAAIVHRLDHVEPGPTAYSAGGERMLALIDRLVAVWDGLPARGVGGTAEVVAAACARGLPVEVVWPSGARRT